MVKKLETTNVVEIPTPNPEPIHALQKEFSLCQATGRLSLIRNSDFTTGDETATESFFSLKDGEILMRRHITELGLLVHDSQFRFIFSDFFESPNTRMIRRTCFDPDERGHDCLNYWVEPLIKPRQGDWQIIKDWLFEILCDSDQEGFDYLIRWLAHLIQRPKEKPEVMLVLMGDEGTGKGTLFKILKRIFGRAIYSAEKPDQIVGRFNAILNRMLIVWSDEAIFVGNAAGQESLKSLITEEYITTELKHQEPKSIRSYHRFIATTNKEHFAQISVNNRRNAFYRVSDKQKQNRSYFGKLLHAIDNTDALPAFVHHLTTLDLTEFDPTKRPITEELKNQKLLSLSGVARYLKEVLDTENFVLVKDDKVPIGGVPYIGRPRILTRDFHEYYTLYDKSAERHAPLQQKAIKSKVKELIPSASDYRANDKHGIEFPVLNIARQEFQSYLTHDIEDWNLPTKKDK